MTKNKVVKKKIVKKTTVKRSPGVLKKRVTVIERPVTIIRPPSMMAVLFDTETTGLVENRTLPLERQPEVIEFYGCLADLATGEIKEEYDTLIRPKKMPLSPEITRITGITDDKLEGKKGFFDHAAGIIKMVRRAPLVIAHNIRFDMDMIEIEMERLEEKIDWPRTMCTVEQTVHLKGFRLSLSNLHLHLFDEAFPGAHRARVDAAGLLRCCVELHRRDVI